MSEKRKKVGLVASIKLVCRDKNGNIKWIEEASDVVEVKQ